MVARASGIVYLTGARNEHTDALASMEGDLSGLGMLIVPMNASQYLGHVHEYPVVAIDNGCFTDIGRKHYEKIGDEGYLRIVEQALSKAGDDLLFATARDVPFDWEGTLRLSLPMLPRIRAAGAPAALVLQDGATIGNIPWDECDVLFIGGSTEWKIGEEAATIARHAKRVMHRGLHMGRVNSFKRLRRAWEIGCDSADGTFLAIAGGLAGFARLHRWLDGVEALAARGLGREAREVLGVAWWELDELTDRPPDDEHVVRSFANGNRTVKVCRYGPSVDVWCYAGDVPVEVYEDVEPSSVQATIDEARRFLTRKGRR